MVASWTDDGPSAVTQRVRHGCQRSRHATGVSRRPNTGLSLSTLTASGCHGLARIASPEMLPWSDLLPHLICSPPSNIGGAEMGWISMATRDELVAALAGRYGSGSRKE